MWENAGIFPPSRHILICLVYILLILVCQALPGTKSANSGKGTKVTEIHDVCQVVALYRFTYNFSGLRSIPRREGKFMMMSKKEILETDTTVETWLSLTDAANRLGVHPATLRRWADQAEFPVMLTPGGHRRFALTDIQRFIAQRRQEARPAHTLELVLAEKALSHTRTEIVGLGEARWLTSFDEEDRARKRLLGRRLMGLLLQYVSADGEDGADAGSLLTEVRAIANEYAANALNAGLSLTEAMQATMFFRDTLMEVAIDLPDSVKVRPQARKKLLRRINTVLNVIQLAMAEAYA